MSAHLDTDALADVLAGLGQRDHLETCEACQAELDSLATALTAVASALAQLPDPELPADLGARISAALAAAAGPAEAPAPEPGPSAAPSAAPIAAPIAAAAPPPAPLSSTVTPIDVKRSGVPGWTKAVGGLATAAALVVGVVLVVNSGSSPSSTSKSSEAADIARNDTGNAYAKDAASLTAVLPQLLKGNAPSRASAAGVAAAPKAQQTPARDAAPALTTSVVDELAPLRGKTALAACLSSLSDPSDPGVPLALDYGTFEDKPALLVLLPSAKKGSVLAFFVGPECNATDSHLLYYEKVASP